GVSAAVAGNDHTCAIVGTTVRCWGANYVGQLGNGSTTPSLTAVTALGITSPTELSCQFQTNCALAAGTVYCWGHGSEGTCGDGGGVDRPTPVAVSLPSAAAHIWTGGQSACAVLIAGELYCWGQNHRGQLGQGDTTHRLTPVRVPMPAA